MTKQQTALTAPGVAVLALVLLALAVIADRRITPQAQAAGIGRTSYEQQIGLLDTTYKRGQAANKAMVEHKLQVTPARCDSLFRASRASELNNTEFEAEAERFFRAGCLAWKKPH